MSEHRSAAEEPSSTRQFRRTGAAGAFARGHSSIIETMVLE